MRRVSPFCWLLLVAGAAWGGEPPPAEDYAAQRRAMVAENIAAAGVSHTGVLEAMRSTPRHEFVLAKWRAQAYLDTALPIGDAQTISPPYVVAYMTAQLDPRPADRVLEIGTGSGYQAAVLSPLVKEVYTIEIVERLGHRAEQTLKRLGYRNVHVRIGDGYQGWPEVAPFDKIIVTCSPENIPQPLLDQLTEGGVMLIPLGERYQQNLTQVTKVDGKLKRERLQATLFVPMTGAAEDERQVLPDPDHPRIVNGDFEKVDPKQGFPLGWHYVRQAEVVSNTTGKLLRFTNSEPGRPSQVLQGLAIDGRKVRRVRLAARVRSENLAVGPIAQQAPAMVLSFYDQRRAEVDSRWLGPWEGSLSWRDESLDIQVPPTAREAILRIGLLGGVGQLDVDDVTLNPVGE